MKIQEYAELNQQSRSNLIPPDMDENFRRLLSILFTCDAAAPIPMDYEENSSAAYVIPTAHCQLVPIYLEYTSASPGEMSWNGFAEYMQESYNMILGKGQYECTISLSFVSNDSRSTAIPEMLRVNIMKDEYTRPTVH